MEVIILYHFDNCILTRKIADYWKNCPLSWVPLKPPGSAPTSYRTAYTNIMWHWDTSADAALVS